jgi:hypothetical protein
MLLHKRINKLESKYLASKEPGPMAMLLWSFHRKSHPELIALPERPPDDWIEFYNGKTYEDLLKIVHHGRTK